MTATMIDTRDLEKASTLSDSEEPTEPLHGRPQLFHLPNSLVYVGSSRRDNEYKIEFIGKLPKSLVVAYVEAALRHAIVEEIEPGHWFAEVKAISGAWGDGESADEAENELREAIVGWVALSLEDGQEIPPIEGLNLNPIDLDGQAT